MKIIDGHIHIFSKIDGANANGSVKGCGYGKTINAGIESPFMPPLTKETCFTADMLLEVMRQNGVEKAVLFQNPTIGSVNEEIGLAVSEHPEIFAGVLQVDPFSEDALEQAERLLENYTYRALKLELSTGWGWTGIHKEKEFHYSMLKPLVEFAGKHRLAVVFDTGDTDSKAYLPGELDELTAQFPEVTFVIEHGGYLTPEGDREKWEQMTDIACRENVYLGICAIWSLLESEYPGESGNDILKRLYDKVGAEKLIWGTDAPCTCKFYTYGQMMDVVRKHARFLSEEELESVCYGNAQKVYFS